jgi:hypothetical protein
MFVENGNDVVEKRYCCVCTRSYIRKKPWQHVCSKECLNLIKKGFDAVREHAYDNRDVYPWKEIVKSMEEDKRKEEEFRKNNEH